MNAHLIIFNRDSAATADGWIHIVPKGELPNSEAGITQVLDEASLDSILKNIEADKTRLGDKWPGVYAGREHFIYDDGQDSAALAWFKNFEKRPDGIWAKDDGLTDIGRDVLKNGHYKFTSFVAHRRHTQLLTNKTAAAPARYRILKLDTVGFTNNANGKELLTPITNRASDSKCPDCGGALDAKGYCTTCLKTFASSIGMGSVDETKQPVKNKMKDLLAAMGLSADASEKSAIDKWTELKNRVATLEPFEADNKTLKNRNTELESEQIESLLDAHGVKEEKLRNRIKLAITTLKNRQERVEALIEFGFKALEAGKGGGTRLLNRDQGNGVTKQPDLGGEDEKALAQKAESEITDYQLKNRCTYTEARNTVRNRKPELFGITRQS